MALIGIKEAARRLGTPERTLYNWIKSGRVHTTVMVNGKQGIDESEIERIQQELAISKQLKPTTNLEARVSELERKVEQLTHDLALLKDQSAIIDYSIPDPTNTIPDGYVDLREFAEYHGVKAFALAKQGITKAMRIDSDDGKTIWIGQIGKKTFYERHKNASFFLKHDCCPHK